MMEKPNSDYEALVLGLSLALTAKTEADVKKCIELTKTIAVRLSHTEIEKAKEEAKQQTRYIYH